MGLDPQVIRERNERAREQLAGDLQALSEKLDVKHQIALRRTGAMHKVQEALGMHPSDNHAQNGGTHNGAVTTIREHPIATAMVGFGVSRLLSGWRREHSRASSNGGSYGYESSFADLHGSPDDSGVKDRVTDKLSGLKPDVDVSGMKSNASAIKATAAEKISDVADTAGSARRSITSAVPTSGAELQYAAKSNMAVFGIGAFALGALAAVLLPRTKVEGRHLGELKTGLMESVQEHAVDARDAVTSGLHEGMEKAKETVKDELQPSEPSNDVSVDAIAKAGGNPGARPATPPLPMSSPSVGKAPGISNPTYH